MKYMIPYPHEPGLYLSGLGLLDMAHIHVIMVQIGLECNEFSCAMPSMFIDTTTKGWGARHPVLPVEAGV